MGVDSEVGSSSMGVDSEVGSSSMGVDSEVGSSSIGVDSEVGSLSMGVDSEVVAAHLCCRVWKASSVGWSAGGIRFILLAEYPGQDDRKTDDVMALYSERR
jgi:hypothetical protein